MNIFWVSALCICGVLLGVMFRTVRTEYTVLLGLAAGVLIFACSVTKLQLVIGGIQKLSEYAGMGSTYLTSLFKIIGIAYLCEFTSDLCKDAGFSAISSQIQIFGRLGILVLSLPVVLSLAETILTLL